MILVENWKDKRPTVEQYETMFFDLGWDEENAEVGYFLAHEDGLECVERIDGIDLFDGDQEAALQASADGVKLLANAIGPKTYAKLIGEGYITDWDSLVTIDGVETRVFFDALLDTPNNRKRLGLGEGVVR